MTNGSTVTPAIAPSGFSGKVVVAGSGSVNFAPAQVGNGVYFLKCCDNSANAYYKFTGPTIGSIFNVNQGQISFYLKSRQSLAQRALSPFRVVLDVKDASETQLFGFYTQAIFRRFDLWLQARRSRLSVLQSDRQGPKIPCLATESP